MGLDCWATSEEIKEAHRRLRAVYFRTDSEKYHALQIAYGILVNAEARFRYDEVYRARKGLPPPQPPNPSILIPSLEPPVPMAEHNHRTTKGRGSPVEMQEVDHNAALKKHKAPRSAITGTRPYQSFLPIPEAYKDSDRHPKLMCEMPKYVLNMAKCSYP
jgi:curved DNA-binding protein CbpA